MEYKKDGYYLYEREHLVYGYKNNYKFLEDGMCLIAFDSGLESCPNCKYIFTLVVRGGLLGFTFHTELKL